jgi:tetraacyldisaccharide 4'-kinase
MVEETALCLRELGASPAVVSRGYGRDSRGIGIVADREGQRLGPRAGGDEPVLLADRLPGIPVIVGENRFEAGWVAIRQCGATAIVLDDGFQHRTLRKDLRSSWSAGWAPWGTGGCSREGCCASRSARPAPIHRPDEPPGPTATAAAADTIRHNTRAPIVIAHYQVQGACTMPAGREITPTEPRDAAPPRSPDHPEGLPTR